MERSEENLIGGFNRFYLREASPLILMQFQITNICSVRIGVL